MDYDRPAFEQTIEQFGEVFFVLDSGEEYIVHGKQGYEFDDISGNTVVRVQGLHNDEYIIAEFPLDAIEHHRTHKEV